MPFEEDRIRDPFADDPSIVDEPTLTIDRTGLIVRWNVAAELTLGWTFDEIAGRNVADALVPEWARHEYARTLSYKGGLNAEGIGRRIRFPAVDRDGHERYVELTPITRADPRTTHFTALLHDVTDQVAAVSDAAWLREAINGASVAMCTVDEHGELLSTNAIFDALLGIDGAELVGRNLLDLAPSTEERTLLQERFELLRRGEELPERVSRYYQPDGTPLDLIASGAPIRSPEGRLRGMVLVFSDVSAQVARQHEFGERLAELQRRSLNSRALRTPNHVRPLKAGPRAELIRETLSRTLDTLDVDAAWITIQRGEFAYLEAVAGPGARHLRPVGATAPIQESYFRQITSGRAASVTLRDPTDDAMPTRRHGLRSYLGVPVLRADASVAAVLCVANEQVATGLGLLVVEQLQRLAANLGKAFDELDARASTDGTTPRLIAIQALLGAISALDDDASSEADAMVDLALAVATRLELGPVEREQVECVALLHDIGKLGVPETVLRKPGPLNDRELELVRENPAIGERIVAGIPALADLAPLLRAEHERWDGSGYPDGLRGEAIPIASRVVLACGAWRAMRSDRVHQPALGRDDALMELASNAGGQFDRRVVEALIAELVARDVS